jgi:hypothetical protein
VTDTGIEVDDLKAGHGTPVKAPSPFFKGTTLQFAWDSTSTGLLMDCAYKYYLTIIQGWRKKDESVHLKFGGVFAYAMEAYAHAKAAGADHEDALDAAVARTLLETWNHERDEDGNRIPGTGTPWEPDNSPKKNRDTLLRTVVWYFEEYKDDPAKTLILPNGDPATEVSFKFESGIHDPYGGEYLLTGHLDKGVVYGDDPFVMDQKTTGGGLGAYYFSQFDLSNQMSQYTFAGKIVWNVPLRGVIIDAAAILVGSTTFGRSITMRSEKQLEEWHNNVAQWLGLAERFADSGKYPMNLQSCNNYGGCVFKGICSKDPSVREAFLKTDFEKRFWNPLEVR